MNYSDEKTDVMVNLRKNRSRKILKIKNGRPTLHVTLRVQARLDDSDTVVTAEELARGYIVPDEILRATEKKIEKTLSDIFEQTKEADCDAFRVKERLFRTRHRYFAAMKEIILRETNIKVTVRASSLK